MGSVALKLNLAISSPAAKSENPFKTDNGFESFLYFFHLPIGLITGSPSDPISITSPAPKYQFASFSPANESGEGVGYTDMPFSSLLSL
jgi:hypothetical protein